MSRWLPPLSNSSSETCFSQADLLSLAIERGDHNAVLGTLKDADLMDYRDSRGLSPLHVAIVFKQHKIVKALLENRKRLHLDVNIESSNPELMGWTAMHFAVVSLNKKAVKALTNPDIGCKVNAETKVGGALLQVFSNKGVEKITVLNQSLKILFMPTSGLAIEAALRPRIANVFGSMVDVVERSCSQGVLTTTDSPLVLTENEIGSILPCQISKKCLIEVLRECKVLYAYKPPGSSEQNYFFPAQFLSTLPQNVWSNCRQYLINAGRFVELDLHLDIISELVVCIRTHLLIESAMILSREGLFFEFQETECLVRSQTLNTEARGTFVLVRSKQCQIQQQGWCCRILHGVIRALTLITGCDSESLAVHFVSSRQLAEGLGCPQMYSCEEVKSACRDGNIIGDDSLQSLLLPAFYHRSEDSPERNSGLLYFDTWSVEVYQMSFRKCYRSLLRSMNCSRVIPHLVQDGYLTMSECEQIVVQYSTNHEMQVISLLGRLDRRQDVDVYIALLGALKNDEESREHVQLADNIILACQEFASSQLFIPEFSFGSGGYLTGSSLTDLTDSGRESFSDFHHQQTHSSTGSSGLLMRNNFAPCNLQNPPPHHSTPPSPSPSPPPPRPLAVRRFVSPLSTTSVRAAVGQRSDDTDAQQQQLHHNHDHDHQSPPSLSPPPQMQLSTCTGLSPNNTSSSSSGSYGLSSNRRTSSEGNEAITAKTEDVLSEEFDGHSILELSLTAIRSDDEDTNSNDHQHQHQHQHHQLKTSPHLSRVIMTHTTCVVAQVQHGGTTVGTGNMNTPEVCCGSAASGRGRGGVGGGVGVGGGQQPRSSTPVDCPIVTSGASSPGRSGAATSPSGSSLTKLTRDRTFSADMDDELPLHQPLVTEREHKSLPPNRNRFREVLQQVKRWIKNSYFEAVFPSSSDSQDSYYLPGFGYSRI